MEKVKRGLKIIFVLLVVAALLLGGFLLFRTVKHAKQVDSYRSVVEKSAAKYGVKPYTNVILGIMMTESKGRGTDLMQSSESAYGDQGKIATKAESIENGVKHFAETYQAAKKADCDLNTAVQAYNFGLQYIDYVAKHGGKNTVELAENYSRDVLSPVLGNKQKSQYRYMKLQSLFYNGGYLYKNGGNMFYANVVKMNQQIVEAYHKVKNGGG
ncbi:lysozyme family protein [Enterococcus sp. CSURQ0835]|uniref:lysozyme family protein n=1 Tax=Enterococcus sp. CSURQ0835 TaxID=2681394 RepID=UPI00135681B2|nr:lysozyme family protein [Enterococcus sp. CSURQ0835]